MTNIGYAGDGKDTTIRTTNQCLNCSKLDLRPEIISIYMHTAATAAACFFSMMVRGLAQSAEKNLEGCLSSCLKLDERHACLHLKWLRIPAAQPPRLRSVKLKNFAWKELILSLKIGTVSRVNDIISKVIECLPTKTGVC